MIFPGNYLKKYLCHYMDGKIYICANVSFVMVWGYFIDRNANLLEAKIELPELYERFIAYSKNKQNPLVPPRKSIRADEWRMYSTSGFGDACGEMLGLLGILENNPEAVEWGKGDEVNLGDKVIYYDNAKLTQSNITWYDAGLPVAENIKGRLTTDTRENVKFVGEVNIPYGDGSVFAKDMEENSFIALVNVRLKPDNFPKTIRSSFFGVNPRYLTMDEFRGYQIIHDGMMRGKQEYLF